DIKKAIEILNHLGFTKEHIMEKYRTEYKLGEVILALDKLPFGDYLEIEGEKEKIEKAISALGLDGDKRLICSYWHLFDDYNQEHGITAPDENIFFDSRPSVSSTSK
ncbi:MAG: CYTH domain-containing protein, partial [Patescibacteria group bacterium]